MRTYTEIPSWSIPVVDTNFNNYFVTEDYVFTSDCLSDIAIAVFPDFIKDRIENNTSNLEISVYNFRKSSTGRNIVFDIDISDESYNILYEHCTVYEPEEFNDFLVQEYDWKPTSWANSLDDFKDKIQLDDNWKAFTQMVCFALQDIISEFDEDYDYEVSEALEEKFLNLCPKNYDEYLDIEGYDNAAISSTGNGFEAILDTEDTNSESKEFLIRRWDMPSIWDAWNDAYHWLEDSGDGNKSSLSFDIDDEEYEY